MQRPVLITGCSSGIGLATTRYLAEREVPVYATVRSASDADRLNEIDGVESFLCDVTSDEQVEDLRIAIDERGRGLWGLVHNAGIAQIGHLTVASVDDVRAVWEVNVLGVHRVTNALVDRILESQGRIVTMSSISGTLSTSLAGVYSMSKHALEAYTDALAAQLGPQGVHCCAVVPGNFESSIMQNLVRRFSLPADASEKLAEVWAPDADVSRKQYPGPEPVAEACWAALFDETPLARYLVVPNADEADLTLVKAAQEWARLNASTPHAWTTERLLEEVAAAAG